MFLVAVGVVSLVLFWEPGARRSSPEPATPPAAAEQVDISTTAPAGVPTPPDATAAGRQPSAPEESVTERMARLLAGTSASDLNIVGQELLAAGQYAEAERAYRRAIELTDDNEDYHYNLGIALSRQGNLAAAEAAYRRAIELYPDYAEAYLNLGSVLELQDRTDEARDNYREALNVLPDYEVALNNLGSLLARQGELGAARQEYERLLEINPASLEGRFNLALIFLRLQETNRALLLLQAVVNDYPDFQPAQLLLERHQSQTGVPDPDSIPTSPPTP